LCEKYFVVFLFSSIRLLFILYTFVWNCMKIFLITYTKCKQVLLIVRGQCWWLHCETKKAVAVVITTVEMIKDTFKIRRRKSRKYDCRLSTLYAGWAPFNWQHHHIKELRLHGDIMYSSNVIHVVMCWIMTPCSIVSVYLYFRGAYFLHQCRSGPRWDSGCLCRGGGKKLLRQDRCDQSVPGSESFPFFLKGYCWAGF
jgi:hypothetical protein